MTERFDERVGQLSGAAFALLFGIGSGITLIGSPAVGAPAAEIQAYFVEHEQNVYVGGILSMLSVPFLLWFAASLRSTLARRERAPHLLSAIVFGSGVAASAVVAAEVMALTVGAVRVREQGEIGPHIAAVLFDLSTAVGGVAVPVTLAAMLVASALVAWRSAGLAPRWFAALTALIGVLGAIVPISSAIFFVVLAWILVVSLALFVRPAATLGGTTS